MNAIQLLEQDHVELRKLLDELSETGGAKAREQLFEKVKKQLTLHEIIEEEIFYPALKEHPKAKEIVLEGYEEHGVVDTIMGELAELPTSDETWGAKFKVMKENIEHHVEEEEGEMFDQARSVFDEQELVELGDMMGRRREEALERNEV